VPTRRSSSATSATPATSVLRLVRIGSVRSVLRGKLVTGGTQDQTLPIGEDAYQSLPILLCRKQTPMNFRPTVAFGLLFASVPLPGCGVDSETIQSFQAAVQNVSQSQSTAAPAPLSAMPSTPAPEARFDPAYPDRRDPFSFPEDAQVGERNPGTQTTVASVEVLGFANVGRGQHVLLRSGETSRSLRSGESIDGVRVMAIHPPTVKLQLGTLVWTATMFDQNDP